MNYGKILRLLDFPSLRQSRVYSCGAAVVQAMLMYYGDDKRENELVEDLNTNRKGTWIKNIVKFFKNRGFKIKHGEEYSIDDIKKFIDKKIPVIIALQAWPEKEKKNWEKGYSNGHYVTVIGYTDRGMIFSDPSSIYRTFLTYKDLNKRWHDIEEDKKVEHYAIIPHGKSPKYNKNKIIKIGSISSKLRLLSENIRIRNDI